MALSRYDLAALAACRLDLVVSVLRRLSTNVVDVLAPDGAYVRVLGGARKPMFVRVNQCSA